MKRMIAAGLVLSTATCLLADVAMAKLTPGKYADSKFFESPTEPMNAPEIGGEMFQTAAADTTVLDSWDFDGPGGVCDAEGWVGMDVSVVGPEFFHVDGDAGGGCNGIPPISGSHSMWCGKEATTQSPFCSWITLPGYGNNWNQTLSTTINASGLTYDIAWDSEDGYDYTYVEWWDAAYHRWRVDQTVNGGSGFYTNVGSAVGATSSAASAGVSGPTKVRIRFRSDSGWSDEDGRWDSVLPGAVIVDNLSLDGGFVEDWEGEACGDHASQDNVWVAAIPSGYGNYAHLVHGSEVLQEDPCRRVMSCVWGFFDDPAVTNYACGGWPLQGAVPYGPHGEGLYISNQIWSPWTPLAETDGQFLLQFRVYRDLDIDANVFYTWSVRTRDNDTGGCETSWRSTGYVYYGAQLDWFTAAFDFSAYVRPGDDDVQVALGVVDMEPVWGCWDFCCHSHAPLFDDVSILHVGLTPPNWSVRDIDLWQDNFPESGGIGPTDYARCDMAQDIIPGDKPNLVPGDSLRVVVTDPSGSGDAGFAVDATGGRSRPAVYVFVKCTDRFGNMRPYTGAQMESPDDKSSSKDTQAGLKRFPLVTGITVNPPVGWEAYRMDGAYTSSGTRSANGFCADLMDLHAGPDAYAHLYEPAAANVGVFVPGDVIHYFLGAKNSLGEWSYYHRTLNGQGSGRRTNNISEAAASPMEWSVLPDRGRLPGDLGDILLVDDADDRGGPAQSYFDFAFKYMGIEDRVDRFDVLGPSSGVGNSLASRVKNIQNQIIGLGTEIYQKILWNCSDLSTSLMGDGGYANGGFSYEKSQDFGLCDYFLTNHPDNPGWAYWGDDVVYDWNLLGGSPTATAVKTKWMNHTFVSGNQKLTSGIISPQVLVSTAPAPSAPYFVPTESFYAHGGCPAINDFDVPGQTGNSRIAYRYNDPATGPVAALSQVTLNSQGTNARFYLSGFAFNFIRDDDTNGVPDYVKHLQEILSWFGTPLGNPVGIEPIVFANRLDSAYPNPFNPTTTIKYSIADAGRVSLRIYNAAGQLVRTLVDEEQSPRPEGFAATWDGLGNRGEAVASGVYFYKLTAKEFSQTKKMVFLK